MIDKSNIAVVNALSLVPQRRFAFDQLLFSDCVIHDVNNAAKGAIGVKKRRWPFYDFNLLNVEQIHVHAVVGTEARHVSCSYRIV